MISFFAKFQDWIVQLPVNPEELTINTSNNNETSENVGIGEVNDIGFKKLKSLNISTFLASYPTSYTNTNGSFREPVYYVNFFRMIQKERKPFRLIVTDLDINMMVSLEKFNYTYKFGTDDIDIELDLLEYRTHNIRIFNDYEYNNLIGRTGNVGSNSNNSRLNERSIPTNYTVKKGDSLYLIARRFYGDGNKWRTIYNYQNNKRIIGGNPNLIYPGQKLILP